MRRAVTLLALIPLALFGGCRTTVPTTPAADLAEAVERLQRPLPGNMSALYRLRVPSSGGLRLAVLSTDAGGQISVSEPFGSALSLTAWESDGTAMLFDLQEGCRVVATDVSSVLGVGHLPLPQAVRLLAGRIPAGPGDVIDTVGDLRLRVGGADWACLVTVSPEPWRVTRVEAASEGNGWWVELEDHSGSFPGVVRIRHPEGRRAELKLVRLQWDTVGELPPLPDLPPCAGQGRR